ncbi:MAG: hypothetical protein P4L84_05690 [Isosphaeraceae bacterium]|nr:hypothetical protein [Isosphaeraceae bacterium]
MQRVERAHGSRYRPPALLALLAVLMAGCREELGPVAAPTTRVTGVVRIGRRPVGGGWIEFYPVAGTVGNLRVAPVGPDGRFAADGVAVGTNMVGLAQMPNAGPYRYQFRSFQSTIRRTIRPGPATTLDLDLAEEAAARATTPR